MDLPRPALACPGSTLSNSTLGQTSPTSQPACQESDIFQPSLLEVKNMAGDVKTFRLLQEPAIWLQQLQSELGTYCDANQVSLKSLKKVESQWDLLVSDGHKLGQVQTLWCKDAWKHCDGHGRGDTIWLPVTGAIRARKILWWENPIVNWLLRSVSHYTAGLPSLTTKEALIRKRLIIPFLLIWTHQAIFRPKDYFYWLIECWMFFFIVAWIVSRRPFFIDSLNDKWFECF